MRTQILDDLLHIFELLGGQVGIIQQPVVVLAMLMSGTEQFDGVVDQGEHFVAALNTAGMILQIRTA